MKGKRAGIFAAGLVLGMIIFIGLSWHSFSTTNRNLNMGIIKALSSTQYKDMENKVSFYLDESAKLASSQAFYEIAKNSAVNKESMCNVINDNIIWNSNCRPEQQFIESMFIEKYNQSFYGFLENYLEEDLKAEYIHIIKEGKIESSAEQKTFVSQEGTSLSTYKLSYVLDPSITHNLNEQDIYLGDFEFIYQETDSVILKCKDNDDVVSCVKKNLNLARWTTKVKKEASYLIFELETKKSFFFEDPEEKFEPVVLNFAMNAE